MSYNETNTDFFSYTGTINRKNYAINMVILIALFTAASFIRAENFFEYTNKTFLLPILMFMISMFKFVLIFSALSVIYRRFSDISENKSERFKQNAKKIFVSIYIMPILYFLCIRYFFDLLPAVLINITDLIFVFVAIPLVILCTLTVTFIKG